jgi:hypothetical protein
MGTLSPLARILNAVLTFIISLAIESAQMGVAVLLVEGVSLCDRTRHLNPKFVGFLE